MVHIYKKPAQLSRRYVLFGGYRFWADGLTRTGYYLTRDIRKFNVARRMNQNYELRVVVPIKYVDQTKNSKSSTLIRVFVYATI